MTSFYKYSFCADDQYPIPHGIKLVAVQTRVHTPRAAARLVHNNFLRARARIVMPPRSRPRCINYEDEDEDKRFKYNVLYYILLSQSELQSRGWFFSTGGGGGGGGKRRKRRGRRKGRSRGRFFSTRGEEGGKRRKKKGEEKREGRGREGNLKQKNVVAEWEICANKITG